MEIKKEYFSIDEDSVLEDDQLFALLGYVHYCSYDWYTVDVQPSLLIDLLDEIITLRREKYELAE